MRLSDAFDPAELPTRPDNPRASARRCVHCGQVYGEHARTLPASAYNAIHIPACWGIRQGFQPEDRNEADQTR